MFNLFTARFSTWPPKTQTDLLPIGTAINFKDKDRVTTLVDEYIASGVDDRAAWDIEGRLQNWTERRFASTRDVKKKTATTSKGETRTK